MTAVGIIGIFSPQQLIRQSRKARDAKTASMLLSDLIGSALTSLATADNATIIQPHFDPGAPPVSHPAHPNVVVVSGDRSDAVAEHLERAAASIRTRWTELTERVRAYLREAGAPGGDAHRWDAQQATFPELGWVVAEGPDPSAATDAAWQLWQARRLIRDGRRLEIGGDGVDGCTLCGRREGWLAAGGRLSVRWTSDLRPWETLCAPCLVVRFSVPANAVGRPFRVPSVSSVAAAPWLAGLPDSVEALDGFADLATAASELGLADRGDQALAHLGSAARQVVPYLDVVYGRFNTDELDEEWLEILLDARRRFLGTVADPSRRYGRYALVSFDGDQMSDQFRSMDWEARAELSERLTRFAVEACPSIVEGRLADGRPSHGSLLYAGGDDGRFLVAAETAVDVVGALAEAFTAMLEGATLSAGIAVAGIHDPLDVVVETANRALEVAKEDFGRASFCVAWITGRGARYSGGTFDVGDRRLLASLDVVAAAFKDGRLPKGLTADIDRLADVEWPAAGGNEVFSDLVRERMASTQSGAADAVMEIHAWLRDLTPTRAAGLVRLARDLASLGAPS